MSESGDDEVEVVPPPGVSVYEKMRQENISRNEQFLRELGIGEIRSGIAAEGQGGEEGFKRRRSKGSATKRLRAAEPSDEYLAIPTRSSSRIRNLDPDEGIEIVDLVDGEDGEYRRPIRQRSEPINVIIDDDSVTRSRISGSGLRDFISAESEEHLEDISDQAVAHCVHRIQSMSNKQLATRIKMISRGTGSKSFEKLLVFYYGLKASGLIDLAESAKAALVSAGVTFSDTLAPPPPLE